MTRNATGDELNDLTFATDGEEDDEDENDDVSFEQLVQEGEEDNRGDGDIGRTEVRAPYRIPRRTDRNLLNLGNLIKDSIVTGVTAAITAGAGSSAKRTREEEEHEKEAQQPILITIPNHTVKDNAYDVIDYEVRKLRPFMGKQADWWKKQRQVAKPIMEDLLDCHLTISAMNPRIIARMHDRGAELNHKMFLENNANVEHRPGKIKLDRQGTAGAFQQDYVEAQGVWQLVDGAWNYATALRSIRPSDYSGHLMLKTMHEVRYFAGACKMDPKVQLKMLKEFMDNIFRKNSLKGRSSAPPLDRTQMLDEARAVMIKNGYDGLASAIGVEPYGGTSQRTGVKNNVGGVASTTNSMGNSGGNGNRRYNVNPAGKTYTTMNVKEKVDMCCRLFNAATGCSRKQCNYRHQCSKVRADGRVCWNKTHGEINHV